MHFITISNFLIAVAISFFVGWEIYDGEPCRKTIIGALFALVCWLDLFGWWRTAKQALEQNKK